VRVRVCACVCVCVIMSLVHRWSSSKLLYGGRDVYVGTHQLERAGYRTCLFISSQVCNSRGMDDVRNSFQPFFAHDI